MKRNCLIFFLFFYSTYTSAQIKHYYFIGMDRDLLKDTGTWSQPYFETFNLKFLT